MDICNIISVRFSLRMHPEWTIKAYGDEVNRESWFGFRANLFKRTLLASIQRQTVMPRRVYLMMDQADERLYAKYLASECALIRPVFSNHSSQISQELHRDYPANVASSRIDSDDMIAPDYIEKVNLVICSSLRSGIEFDYVVACRGIRTDLKEAQEIYYSCSPFLTLFEASYSGKEVYGFNHELVEGRPHIKDRLARWAQVIHGSNVSNNFIPGGLHPDDFENATISSPKLIAAATTPLCSGTAELFGLPASF
jgi:hypothetical protein